MNRTNKIWKIPLEYLKETVVSSTSFSSILRKLKTEVTASNIRILN